MRTENMSPPKTKEAEYRKQRACGENKNRTTDWILEQTKKQANKQTNKQATNKWIRHDNGRSSNRHFSYFSRV